VHAVSMFDSTIFLTRQRLVKNKFASHSVNTDTASAAVKQVSDVFRKKVLSHNDIIIQPDNNTNVGIEQDVPNVKANVIITVPRRFRVVIWLDENIDVINWLNDNILLIFGVIIWLDVFLKNA
jgi:hypothetical protein